MNKKKVMALGLAAVMAAGCMTGCGNDNNSSSSAGSSSAESSGGYHPPEIRAKAAVDLPIPAKRLSQTCPQH